MRGRVLGENCAQDERGGARLAGAGGAEDGEVLAQQLVDPHHGRNGAILADAADTHAGLEIAAEGRLELGLGGHPRAVAERGIGGDTAGEDACLAALVLPQLAHEAELGDPDLYLAVAMRRHRHAERGDNGKHHGLGRINGEQRAHVGALVVLDVAFVCRIEKDDRLRAGDRDDAPDRSIGRGGALSGARHVQLHVRRATHVGSSRSLTSGSSGPGPSNPWPMTASRASVTESWWRGGRATVTCVPAPLELRI